MSHCPNPFDFVPFTAQPTLRSEQEFDALGDKVSGYLELQIKALTPLHIAGLVEGGGAAEHHSHHYRQDGQPCIPAASIRGCLRAFVEALTAGWVSQATEEYGKVNGLTNKNGRHIGFRTFADYTPERSRRNRTSPPAVNPAFEPGFCAGQLDVAGYLFGVVVEGKQAAYAEQAQKSKLSVEDAYLDPADLNAGDYWMPDVAMPTAFMGGAKPSASNWWYFRPAQVWQRNLPHGAPVAEFVGEQFRGRKFYFHQDPRACVQAYHPDSARWAYPSGFRQVRLECLEQDRSSRPFRIYLDGVPQPLFRLLVLALQPGEHMRHKLGYAKAYGYGSIEFLLAGAHLRPATRGIPPALAREEPPAFAWLDAARPQNKLRELIDWYGLDWLARILGWPHQGLLFMYPPYRALDADNHRQQFQHAIPHARFVQQFPASGTSVRDTMVLTPKEARAVAETMWETKQPIDFRLYQERAEGWSKIKARQP